MDIKQLTVGSLFTNCYILADKDRAIVIDPGDEAGRIFRELQSKKTDYIILTHYHFDHSTAATELKKLTGAKILIHQNEKEYLSVVVDRYLKEGEEIGAGRIRLKVIHTPGHTPGSICLLGENFIFTGDTLFAGGATGRTDFPGGSPQEMERSLIKLKKILRPPLMVYPGHGESFTISS